MEPTQTPNTNPLRKSILRLNLEDIKDVNSEVPITPPSRKMQDLKDNVKNYFRKDTVYDNKNRPPDLDPEYANRDKSQDLRSFTSRARVQLEDPSKYEFSPDFAEFEHDRALDESLVIFILLRILGFLIYKGIFLKGIFVKDFLAFGKFSVGVFDLSQFDSEYQ
jgi:hypothetical protein